MRMESEYDQALLVTLLEAANEIVCDGKPTPLAESVVS